MSSREKISRTGENSTPQNASQHWHAHLNLQLSHSARGTRLSRSAHKGPLYVQKPFYPEGPDCAHLYLLHPPGGLVSGDELTIRLDLEPNAKALVTTPGAAKMYRARDTVPEQRQITRLQIAEHASLEWFPMESIVYQGAHALVDTRVEMSSTSFFCAWELMCLGLPASDQPFDKGRFQQRYRIFVDGIPRFIDHFQIEDNNREIQCAIAGLQGASVTGFLVAGPLTRNEGTELKRGGFQPDSVEHTALLENLRGSVSAAGLQQRIAITLVNDFLLIRYLGPSTHEARREFVTLWSLIRPALIGIKACPPRIWYT